ncbi:ubiquitin thioesterase ZRANB1, partial [Silurus asotus]
MTDPHVKWACEYCTYENWPSAIKCTMCRAQRPGSAIMDVSEHCGVSGTGGLIICPDSSARPRMRPLRPCEPGDHASVSHPDEDYNDKNRLHGPRWSCTMCTYENWAETRSCAVCKHPGPNSVGSASTVSNNEREQGGWSTRRNRTSSPVSSDIQDIEVGAHGCDEDFKKIKQIKNRMRKRDWKFLNACIGVVEGDLAVVEVYKSSGGDLSRQLTSDEVRLLNRPSAFDVGFTLVHLAIRFQRQDMLAILLTEVSQRAVKCIPAMVCSELTEQIRREISTSLHQRKGDFACYFLTDLVTFTLPADIEDLPPAVQEKLFDDLLDRGVQKELEEDDAVINWSLELGSRVDSRLYALWNRTAGDCLLDSVLQATWGIYDKDSVLRNTLHSSLHHCSDWFYTRWKEWESWYSQTFGLHFSLREEQWQEDWAFILSLASQPGASLEQTHIFVLAHILRRPIIVYGVKYYKSFRGETLGFTRFQGVYLPLLWEQSFCWKSPIALGYTRGHFSALVAMETDCYDNRGAGANLNTDDDVTVTFLPLVDSEKKLLQIHFLSVQEV